MKIDIHLDSAINTVIANHNEELFENYNLEYSFYVNWNSTNRVMLWKLVCK